MLEKRTQLRQPVCGCCGSPGARFEMNPVYDHGGVQLFCGDALKVLKTLKPESVNCVISSPPYWGLRNYSLEPTVWGGNEDCIHAWGPRERGRRSDVLPLGESEAKRLGTRNQQTGMNDGGRFCQNCEAWLGDLGLEPTPEMFVEHLVWIFREIRRVLHSSGTVWLNLGDCMITKPTNHGSSFDPKYMRARDRTEGPRCNRTDHPEELGLKNKDLAMIPARVALALQVDGWYLRSQIPWLKRNGMVESTTDRPTAMVEYIYLLSKREQYFYDRDAGAVPQAEHERTRRLREQASGLDTTYALRRDTGKHGQTKPGASGAAKTTAARHALALKGTRSRRNSDWAFESLRGMICDGDGEPLTMIVNPQPFGLEMCQACQRIYPQREFRRLAQLDDEQKTRICRCGETKWISHFATFSTALVEPMILLGTSDRGACINCGLPWVRQTESANSGDWNTNPSHKHLRGAVHTMRFKESPGLPGVTLGWESQCSHPLFPCETEPCTVLDPFAGSGTTGVVAARHERKAILIERSPLYCEMIKYRLGEGAVEQTA